MRNTLRIGSRPFEAGERVLAPADVGGTLASGTVVARRQYKTRSTREAYNETHIQLLVEFDQITLGQKWILSDGCQPLEEPEG